MSSWHWFALAMLFWGIVKKDSLPDWNVYNQPQFWICHCFLSDNTTLKYKRGKIGFWLHFLLFKVVNLPNDTYTGLMKKAKTFASYQIGLWQRKTDKTRPRVRANGWGLVILVGHCVEVVVLAFTLKPTSPTHYLFTFHVFSYLCHYFSACVIVDDESKVRWNEMEDGRLMVWIRGEQGDLSL